MSLAAVVRQFDLEVITRAGVDLATRTIDTAELNRPGLQWAGFAENFPNERLQIIGRTEVSYLLSLPDEERRARLESYSRLGVPAAIVTRGLEVTPDAVAIADRFGVPLLRTGSATTDFVGHLNWFLALELAPRQVLHAGLVDVAGEGVLIQGRAGIGKSETALELIRRGHLLIADDTVEVRRPSGSDLIGRAPGRMRHFMEIKGIGIVNLRLMYGIGSVKASSDISMVVSLEAADARFDPATAPRTREILDIRLPLVTIPVRPGRSTAILVETAAMEQRARRLQLGRLSGEASAPLADLYGRLA